jgi:hypothetical protein
MPRCFLVDGRSCAGGLSSDSDGDPAALIGLGVHAIRLIVTSVASRRRLRAGPFRVSGEVDDVALESGELVGAVHDGLIQSLPAPVNVRLLGHPG